MTDAPERIWCLFTDAIANFKSGRFRDTNTGGGTEYISIDALREYLDSGNFRTNPTTPIEDMYQNPRCYDCKRPYGKAGFPDLIIPHEHWAAISPTGDEGGLLCPSCLCARLEIHGIKTHGDFTSGPLRNPDFKLTPTPPKGE